MPSLGQPAEDDGVSSNNHAGAIGTASKSSSALRDQIAKAKAVSPELLVNNVLFWIILLFPGEQGFMPLELDY
jgi:hypothetical protein